MSSGMRVLAGLAAIGLVLGALVAVGRRGERDDERRQVSGLAAIAATVGRLDGPSLSGYRELPRLDCLTYRRGSNALALELCVDRVGRVVEAIDRRRPVRRIFSLRFDPSASTLRVDRALVDRVLRGLRAGR